MWVRVRGGGVGRGHGRAMGIAHLRHDHYDEGNDDEDVQILGEMMIIKGVMLRIKNDDIYMGPRSPHLT